MNFSFDGDMAKEYGVNEANISSAIPFDMPSLLTSQDKFDILIYVYKKEFGYEALTEMINVITDILKDAQPVIQDSVNNINLTSKNLADSSLEVKKSLEAITIIFMPMTLLCFYQNVEFTPAQFYYEIDYRSA